MIRIQANRSISILLNKKFTYQLLLILFVITLNGCNTSIPEKNFFIGTWKIQLRDVDDSYSYILEMTEGQQWILENEYQSKDDWEYHRDTLTLKNYTKSKENNSGKIYLNQVDMRYIIINKGDNYFDAIPYFGWESEDQLEVRFERM